MKSLSNLPELIFTFLLTKVLKRNKKYPFIVNILIFFAVPIFKILSKIISRLHVKLLPMNPQPKLIILYGFAASGKTTIARKYVDSHPLAMMIEGDELIAMMGDWRKFEKEARKLVYEHTCSIVKNQLHAGYDIVLPYLLTDVTEIDSFKKIANDAECSLHEIYLDADKEVAIARLLKRGRWGEVGSPLLTEQDRPEMESLFDTMNNEMSKVPEAISIEIVEDDIESTYQKFLEVTAN